MSDRRSGDGSGLSPQTLIVASLASLTAAIVVSTFWQGGTPIAAAITPVVVAIASELYSRPARRITALSARAAERTRTTGDYEPPRDRVRVGAPPPRLPEREPLREPEGTGPIRVYRSQSADRRRVHVKAAIATAVIAFAIAATVLTVPELLFGGSVASHGKTTLFGGHKHKSTAKKKNETTPTTTTPTQTAPQQTQTQTTTTPTAPPAQTVPQTTTPTQPPAGGTPPPQGTSAPAQTPGQ
jgi:hypothetical protein